MKLTQLPRHLPLCLSVIVVLAFAFGLAKPRFAHGRRAQNSFTTVSAASFTPGLSPGGIAAGFGTRLSTREESTSTRPLPTSLAGTTVKVNGQLAPLFYVSAMQVNYLIPPDSPLGNLQVIVTSGDGTISTGTVQVNDVAPAIFTANSSGSGLPSAYLVRVLANGSQGNEPVDARPIDPGPAGDRIFLVLYLTGVRRAAAGATKVIIAANELNPTFVGESPDYIGLDQINVELPRYLGGRGGVSLQVKAADRTSNLTEIQMGGLDIRSATTTTLTSSAITAVAGQTINFTARVMASAQGAGIPVGDVILLDNGVMIGRLPIDAGQAVFSYAFATPGSHAITANFEGRANFKESTGALAAAQVVTKAQSTVAVTSSSNPANRDQVIDLIAELRPAPPSTLVPTGVVQFKADNAPLATPITLINGRASLSVSTLAVGNRAITADYYGDPSFNSSASAAFQQVVNTPALQVGAIERPSPVYASDEITINGSGFTTNPADHEVEVVDESGAKTTAQVTSATASQLKARVPFGAGSGSVRVNVRGVESESPDRLNLGTSVSGFVQAFSGGTRTPVAGLSVSLMEPTGRTIDAVTNNDGSFVLKGATPLQSPFFSRIAIGAQAVNGINYPAQVRRITPLNGRDTQYSGDSGLANIIEIKPNSTTTTATIGENTPANESLSVAAPASAEEIAIVITSGHVTFDTNNSTITFPGGGTGNLTLTVLDPGRTPSNLPAGRFNSTIAQITPFGATLSPGGKLTFPNSDGIPSGTPVRVFRFDQAEISQTLGQFIDIGDATISEDGTKIETAGNAVTQTSYYFVSRQWPTATIIGKVLDADGRALRRAVVNARGQAVFTDNFGGFVLASVPVITPDGTNDQLTIEISFVRGDGSIVRMQRTIIGLKADETRQINEDFVLPRVATNRAPQIFAPSSLVINEGETKDFNFIISDPDGNPVSVGVDGASFATITGSANPYTLRLAPGANTANNYTLTIAATDTPITGPRLSAMHTVAVTVRPANNSAPTANYLAVTTNEDMPASFTLPTNNPGGGGLIYSFASLPAHGRLSGTAPNLTYMPGPDFNGIDSFNYKVSGGGAESNVATVFIGVNAVNDAPVLTLSSTTSLKASAGETVKIDLSVTDMDTGQAMSFSAMDLPPGASFVTTATGAQFSWTPIFLQAGTYTVNLRVTDDGMPGLSDTETVTIMVDPKLAKTSGPEGGRVTSFAVNATHTFAGVEGAGVFRSSNNGKAWEQFNNGLTNLNVTTLIVSGSNIFAGTSGAGLFRSTNNGQSWVRISIGLTSSSIRSLATTGNTLFAGTAAGVFRSSNNGESWVQVNNGLTNLGVNALAINGTDIFAGTVSGGVFRSANNGQNWVQVNNGLTTLSVTSLVTKGNTILAGMFRSVNDSNGVFVSTNRGESWTPSNNGLTDLRVASLTTDGNQIFVGTGCFGCATSGSLYVSTNDGQNWSKVNTGTSSQMYTALLTNGSNMFAGTLGGGTLMSTNAGQSWFPVNSGLTASVVLSIALKDDLIIAGTQGSGVSISTDNGQSWKQLNKGLNNPFVNAVAIIGNLMFAGTGDPLLGINNPGLYVSQDNGENWSRANIPGSYVFAVTVSGENIYAGLHVGPESGVYLSTDKGQTWTKISNEVIGSFDGIRSVAVNGSTIVTGTNSYLVISRNNGGSWAKVADPQLTGSRVYSIAVSGNNIFVVNTRGLFLSTDNGLSWTKSDTGLPVTYSVAVSGGNAFAATSQGIFMSTDTGQSWTRLNSSAQSLLQSAIAADSTRIAAALPYNGVYLLTNGRQSWSESNNGLPTRFVNAVTVTGQNVFAGTAGSGVFRSPDQGQNWQSASSGLPENANVQALSASGVNLFAGLFGNGVYRSNNDGANWVFGGLAQQNINALQTSSTGLIFAATDTGVFRSSTSTDSWTIAGLSNQRVVSLALVGTRLLAGTYGGGIYSSTDDGANWTQIGSASNGLANPDVTGLAVGADGTTLFAGTDGGGIYRSTNAGQSWTAVNTDIPQKLNVYGFAVSGTKLYAGSIYGVFLSEDNGEHWKQINAGLLDIYVTSLGVSGKTLIAGTRVGGVFTSQIP